MTISLRLTDKDTELFKKYAALHNMTVSQFLRDAAIEKIEDELDLQAYERAMEEYLKDPVSYSLDDVAKELGID